MQEDYLYNNQIIPWFKTKAFKITVLVLAILAVVSVVLFSEQIGDLLELFGLKAATESRHILIDGVGNVDDPSHFEFLDGNYSITPDNSIILDNTNRLILNPDS